MKNIEKKNIAIITIFSTVLLYISLHLYFILKEDGADTHSSPTSSTTTAAFSVPEAPLEKVKAVYYEQFVPEKKAFEKLNQQLGDKIMTDSTLNLKSIMETKNKDSATPPSKPNLDKKPSSPSIINQQSVALENTQQNLAKPVAFKRRLVAASNPHQKSHSARLPKTTFETMVFGDQQITSDHQVKLLLNQDFSWNGFSIPKNSFIFPVLTIDDDLATLSFKIAGQEFVATIYQPSSGSGIDHTGQEIKKEVLNETVNQVSRVASSKIPFFSGISSAVSLTKQSKRFVKASQISLPNKMKLLFIQQ